MEEPLPEGVTLDLVPDPAGVDSLTRQIRQTGRAYPLFDIAHLILKRPDRYHLHFRMEGNQPDGTPRQFYTCNLDDTVWLSEGDAVRHVLSKHFDTFYQTEKIAVEPPKGTYTFVAQCGMSGTILGPPNLHEYQTKLQRLHAERYSRMPFDVYKSRVRIVRDEAIVKKWVEEQSFKFEYNCLNLPEPLKLGSREAVEQHFRQTHLPNIIRPQASHVVKTAAAREALPPPLRRVSRREFELAQRFPLRLVTRLSDDFAHRGLHFFKVNKTVLHVSVARPRYLDLEANPVSEGIKKIVDTILSVRDCTRRKLLETLGVPLAPAVEAAPAAPASAPAPVAPPAEGSAEAPAEGTAAAPPAAPAPVPAPAAEVAPSPELQAIVTDLHWLIHEGHVIEFANGHLEVAKKPAPKPPPQPPRPPRVKEQAAAPAPAAATAVATAEAPSGEASAASAEAAAVVPATEAPAGDAPVAAADPAPASDAAPAAEASAPVAAAEVVPPVAEADPAPTDDESKINPS